MVALVFIPWLIWGFAIHTERLHDRYTSAWWLLVFYVVPGVLGHFAKAAWFAEGVGMVLHYVLALASFAFTIPGFVEIGCLYRGAQHIRLHSARPPSDKECVPQTTRRYQASSPRKTKKGPMAVLATGRMSFGRRGISPPSFDRFALAEFTSADFHLMDLRQYNVFDHAHGVCGSYSR
jgi:hypothetical protein